jgi:hypothetical protein
MLDHGNRARSLPDLLHRRLADAGQLLEPVVGDVQDVGDGPVAGLLKAPGTARPERPPP